MREDIEKLNAIPILDVARALGLDVIHGNKAYCFGGHDSSTPSLSFNLLENYRGALQCLAMKELGQQP